MSARLKVINRPSPRATVPLTKPKKGSAIECIVMAQTKPELNKYAK